MNGDIFNKILEFFQLNTLPADVESNEGNPDPHDEEEGLEGGVVLQGLDGEALHGAHSVVQLELILVIEIFED